MEERLASIEAHLIHLREDVAEIKAQDTRIRALEIWRSYLTGALAVLTFVLGLLHLGGCAAPAIVPDSKPFAYRPASVLYDSGMNKECQEAILFAAVFWTVHGIDYLEVHEAPSDSAVVLGIPVAGQIGVHQGPLSPNQLGETAAWGRHEIHSAEITLATCDYWVATHELGHALGLPHTPAVGHVMSEALSIGGWAVSPRELEWLR